MSPMRNGLIELGEKSHPTHPTETGSMSGNIDLWGTAATKKHVEAKGLFLTGWWFNQLEKYESQWEGLSHISWKIKNV